MDLKRGIDKAVKSIVVELGANSKAISDNSKSLKLEPYLQMVIMVSAK